MRTTIELDDAVRAALLRKAAERGDRGYSDLINEILRKHLAAEEDGDREERIRRVAALEGAWGPEAAEEARARIKELRASWRDPLRQ